MLFVLLLLLLMLMSLLMLLMHVCGPVGLFVFFEITAGSSLYGLLGPDPAAEAI